MQGLIFNGTGGLDGAVIAGGFENLRVPLASRPGLWRKLLILAAEVLNGPAEGNE